MTRARRAAFTWLFAAAISATRCGASEPRELPERLSQTGLYADATTQTVDAKNLEFAPQYPLWTDGARKRRWIQLPDGEAIDASDPDAWRFPVGTKLWKELAFDRRIETRMIEHVSEGEWRYAAYVWDEAESDAVLAPPEGVRGACESAPGVAYDVPCRADCTTCHAGGPSPVLGFSAIQLSPDRDQNAPHADAPLPGTDLPSLVASGRVHGLPASLLMLPPRAGDAGPRDRAARGWLHANCGHCHNGGGPLAELDLDLAVHLGGDGEADALLATTVGRASAFEPDGGEDAMRIRPGDPERSTLFHRAVSRDPLAQMPPLGTHRSDPDAISLLADWIREDLTGPATTPKENVDRS
jgi:hypothetical protein